MPPGDDNDEDDGRVLAPEELDISDDEHVAEIEDGRYVVSPNDPIGDVDGIETNESESQPTPEQSAGDVQRELDDQSPPPSNESNSCWRTVKPAQFRTRCRGSARGTTPISSSARRARCWGRAGNFDGERTTT